jgi:excisionase family DNA binding protein
MTTTLPQPTTTRCHRTVRAQPTSSPYSRSSAAGDQAPEPQTPHTPGKTRPTSRSAAPERWVSTAYAASFLAVSKMTIYRLVHSGQLPHTTINGHFRVPLSAIESRANPSI